MSTDEQQRPILGTTLREEETVTPLELFFDLVFVLALTQCTALMSAQPTWAGVARGLLVLAVLWWAWVGYAWLTSAVDPEEGVVRLVMFAVMAGLLVVSLAVPRAFDSEAVLFVAAYAIVRAGQLTLFAIASRGDPNLARSIAGLAVSTSIGIGLLLVATTLDGAAQGVLWALAIVLDVAGPYVHGSEGWRLAPRHFAERHGLIVIIALGESIVAIGIGAGLSVDAGTVLAAIVGVALAAALWWLYFDVTAVVAEQNLVDTPEGKERNELARDAYSYLHFPMVAGIVLVALGLKKTLADVGEPLATVPAVALCGGAALFLAAEIGFRLRHVGTVNRQRTLAAVLLIALVPLATRLPAVAAVALVAALLAVVILYEAVRFAESRDHVRHRMARGGHE